MRILFRNVAIADSAFSSKEVQEELPKGLSGVKLEGKGKKETFDVLVEDEKIVCVCKGERLSLKEGHPQNAEAKICEGGTLSPGWVDMRVQLTDPGFEWKDDLNSLSKAAVAGGFTRLICLPNTKPVIDNRDFVESLQGRSRKMPVHFHAYGAVTRKTEGKELAESYDMHRSGAVGFTDGLHPLQDAGILLRALQYLHSFGGLLVNYPIDLRISHGGQVNEGKVSTRMGLPGSPALAEEVMLARDLKLLEYFPNRMHLGPITTAGSLKLLAEAKKQFPELTVEAAVPYIAFSDEELLEFDPNFKLFPPLRGKKDREALCEAVKNGVVDVLVSDHQPQGIEEKNTDFAAAEYGMNGLQTAFSLAWETLHPLGVSLETLVDRFSVNPRRILRLPEVHIKQGGNAELTWFDENASQTPEVSSFYSRSKNSPFFGRKLPVQVLGVVAKGQFHTV